MNRLTVYSVALILANLFAASHYLQMDKQWNHVVSTKEHSRLMLKHGIVNTEIVIVEGGRQYYFNEVGQVCEFK